MIRLQFAPAHHTTPPSVRFPNGAGASKGSRRLFDEIPRHPNELLAARRIL